MNEKIINPVQIGFVENHRTDHIFTFKSIISRQNLCSLVDFKNSYDIVWHEGLFTKFSEVYIKGQFLKLIKSLHRQSCCAVKIGKFRTEFMLCEKDIR